MMWLEGGGGQGSLCHCYLIHSKVPCEQFEGRIVYLRNSGQGFFVCFLGLEGLILGGGSGWRIIEGEILFLSFLGDQGL